VRLAGYERQGVEALILAQVLDKETWVVPSFGGRDCDCSASLSGVPLHNMVFLPFTEPASLGDTAATHPEVVSRVMSGVVNQVYGLCALGNKVLRLGVNDAANS
jgi:hypothetical protein